jgi:hypothetical protein
LSKGFKRVDCKRFSSGYILPGLRLVSLVMLAARLAAWPASGFACRARRQRQIPNIPFLPPLTLATPESRSFER